MGLHYMLYGNEYILEKKIFCSVVPGANLLIDTFQNHRMRCNTRNLQQGQQLLFAITDKAGMYMEMIQEEVKEKKTLIWQQQKKGNMPSQIGGGLDRTAA
jgi:hypothetical protein